MKHAFLVLPLAALCAATLADTVPAASAAGGDGVRPAPLPGLDRTQFHIGCYAFTGSRAQTPEHVADAKALGLDFVLGGIWPKCPCYEDFATNGISACAAFLISKWKNNPRRPAEEVLRDNPPEFIEALLDEFEAEHHHPGIGMLGIWDEPSAEAFPFWAEVVRRIDARYGEGAASLNLFPNYASVAENSDSEAKSQLGTASYAEHIARYVATVPTPFIMFDHYPIYDTPARTHQFSAQWYGNLREVAVACRASGRDMRVGGQANSRPIGGEKSGKWAEPPTENQLRYQAFSAMAFGANCIIWGCWNGWWTNNLMNADGTLGQQYYRVLPVNAEIRRLAGPYMEFRNVATHFVGFGDDLQGLGKFRIVPVPALNLPAAKGLAATDGSSLVVGEMEARAAGDSRRALFIYAANDPEDIRRETHTVRFRPAAAVAAAFGPNGPVEVRKDEVGCAISLPDNSCALVIFDASAL